MTDQDFDFVCRLIRDRSAIVLEPGKEYLVESRLLPLARDLKIDTVSKLIGLLRTRRDEVLMTRVVEAMVTTETLFFRDHHPFESLRSTVLPELIVRRKQERRLDVWCAACSTGQEPYSLILLIREYFPELSGWQINILATDLSGGALSRAREGKYNQIEVNRGLPACLLVKYFQQNGASWELRKDLRQAVEFRELNLIRPWPVLPRMDIVFLRNVMIYFDVETKKSILDRVTRLLRPSGYLLLGGAETTINLNNSFRRVEELKGGFYRLSD
jgi:chemotaxis protein methyltransferase CheR